MSKTMDEIMVNIGGVDYTAEYEIADGCITVFFNGDEACTQKGDLPSLHIARLLLRQMVREEAKNER